MILLFPQWQGAGRRDPIIRGTNSLKDYYGDQITHRIITEKHTMVTNNPIKYYSAIYNQTLRCRELLKKEQPKKLFTIGGDCGVELMPVSYLNERYENLGIIWFDAHADANTPASSVSKNFHGMPLRQLCGDGDERLGQLSFSTVKPEQILYLGLRDVDVPEKEWIRKKDIFVSSEAKTAPITATLRQRKVQNLYIHFDVDVLDKTVYRHSLLPSDGGINILHAYKVIKTLNEEFNVVGTSLTEVVAASQKELEPLDAILKILVTALNNSQ